MLTLDSNPPYLRMLSMTMLSMTMLSMDNSFLWLVLVHTVAPPLVLLVLRSVRYQKGSFGIKICIRMISHAREHARTSL